MGVDPQRQGGIRMAEALGDGADVDACGDTGNERCSKCVE
jgi:hypothetical protein